MRQIGRDNAQIITRRLGRKTETETIPIRVEIIYLNNKKTTLKRQTHEGGRGSNPQECVHIVLNLTSSQREEHKELRRRRKTMLEELEEKEITDTTVIKRKGQLHKVKKRHSERGETQA